jgi:hypothetical protein
VTEITLSNKELDEIYSKAAKVFALASHIDREKNFLVSCIIQEFVLYCKTKNYVVESGKVYKV